MRDCSQSKRPQILKCISQFQLRPSPPVTLQCCRLKNLHNLVQSLTDKPINDKLLVFSDKIVYVWTGRLDFESETTCAGQKPGGSAWVG